MSNIRVPANKFSKDELTKQMHMTRPPRMEGKVKNAGVNSIRKPKKAVEQKSASGGKPQSTSNAQRKNYQLKSQKNKG